MKHGTYSIDGAGIALVKRSAGIAQNVRPVALSVDQHRVSDASLQAGYRLGVNRRS